MIIVVIEIEKFLCDIELICDRNLVNRISKKWLI